MLKEYFNGYVQRKEYVISQDREFDFAAFEGAAVLAYAVKNIGDTDVTFGKFPINSGDPMLGVPGYETKERYDQKSIKFASGGTNPKIWVGVDLFVPYDNCNC